MANQLEERQLTPLEYVQYAFERAQYLRAAVNEAVNRGYEGCKQRVRIEQVNQMGWRFLVFLNNTTVLSCATPPKRFKGDPAVSYEVWKKAPDSAPDSAPNSGPRHFDCLQDARDFVVQTCAQQSNAE